MTWLELNRKKSSSRFAVGNNDVIIAQACSRRRSGFPITEFPPPHTDRAQSTAVVVIRLRRNNTTIRYSRQKFSVDVRYY